MRLVLMLLVVQATGVGVGGAQGWRKDGRGREAIDGREAGKDTLVRELQIKVGFCFKFLFFTEWPPEASAGEAQTLAVGVVGDAVVNQAFGAMDGEDVQGKSVEVLFLGPDAALDDVRGCQMLFVAAAMEDAARELVGKLAGRPVLVVSDGPGLVRAGGIVRLLVRDDKVRFVIDRTAAERAGISFRSRLLRLADRVLEDGS